MGQKGVFHVFRPSSGGRRGSVLAASAAKERYLPYTRRKPYFLVFGSVGYFARSHAFHPPFRAYTFL